ncbi:hypothetical protein C8J56DRAFT_1040538 [Mycena floridula]|nr:hypothetical protein C8J56DRAFT_1040538 [Mycena floridula]
MVMTHLSFFLVIIVIGALTSRFVSYEHPWRLLISLFFGFLLARFITRQLQAVRKARLAREKARLKKWRATQTLAPYPRPSVRHPIYPMNQPPPLRQRKKGVSPLYVCGWSFRWAWLKKNTQDLPKRGKFKRDSRYALRSLWRRIHDNGGVFFRSTVYDEKGCFCPFIVIASNRTQADIDRMNNLENIRTVQAAMGVAGEPKWYRVSRE